MAYIGNEPVIGQWRKLTDISSGFNGVTTTFTLSVPPGTSQYYVTPGSASQLLISLGGIIQEPDVDYTVSLSTITFTTPPTLGLNFFGILCGDALNAGVPSDGTIIDAKVASNAAINSTKLKFNQSGVGSVERTVDNKLKDIVSVKDFGAVGDGVADDTAAIQAAIDSISGSSGAAIYFPGGYYKTTSTITVKKDLISFLGDGARASVIRVHHNTGPGVKVEHVSSPGSTYVSGFGMSDIMIRAFTETTANSALLLNKVQLVTLQNVHLEDHYGGLHVLGGNNHYYSNLYIRSARTTAPVSWSAPKAGSFFLKVDRSSDNQTPFEIFINNFNFRWDAVAYIENGIEINSVDGIWLSNGHIMGCSNANMIVRPIDGDEQITGIRTDNVWFDNNSPYGLYVANTTTNQFGVIELYGSRFLTPTTAGIWIDSSAINFSGLLMNGGVVHRSAGFGVMIREGRQCIFNTVEFAACNTLGLANTSAISIQNAKDNVIISNCHFTDVQDLVTAAAMQGVRITAAATSQVTVSGCSFNLDAAALDVSDSSTSDFNNYSNNTTTKSPNVTTVTSSSLDVPEIGDVFYVSNGLNFNNISGRWGGRRITLVFAGICTVTHSVGGIRLAGSVNFVSKNGDTLSLVYLTSINDWIEVGRMIS